MPDAGLRAGARPRPRNLRRSRSQSRTHSRPRPTARSPPPPAADSASSPVAAAGDHALLRDALRHVVAHVPLATALWKTSDGRLPDALTAVLPAAAARKTADVVARETRLTCLRELHDLLAAGVGDGDGDDRGVGDRAGNDDANGDGDVDSRMDVDGNSDGEGGSRRTRAANGHESGERAPFVLALLPVLELWHSLPVPAREADARTARVERLFLEALGHAALSGLLAQRSAGSGTGSDASRAVYRVAMDALRESFSDRAPTVRTVRELEGLIKRVTSALFNRRAAAAREKATVFFEEYPRGELRARVAEFIRVEEEAVGPSLEARLREATRARGREQPDGDGVTTQFEVTPPFFSEDERPLQSQERRGGRDRRAIGRSPGPNRQRVRSRRGSQAPLSRTRETTPVTPAPDNGAQPGESGYIPNEEEGDEVEVAHPMRAERGSQMHRPSTLQTATMRQALDGFESCQFSDSAPSQAQREQREDAVPARVSKRRRSASVPDVSSGSESDATENQPRRSQRHVTPTRRPPAAVRQIEFDGDADDEEIAPSRDQRATSTPTSERTRREETRRRGLGVIRRLRETAATLRETTGSDPREDAVAAASNARRLERPTAGGIYEPAANARDASPLPCSSPETPQHNVRRVRRSNLRLSTADNGSNRNPSIDPDRVINGRPVKTGRFEEYEDGWLLLGLRKYGWGSWALIAKDFGGERGTHTRSGVSLKDRARSLDLDPYKYPGESGIREHRGRPSKFRVSNAELANLEEPIEDDTNDEGVDQETGGQEEVGGEEEDRDDEENENEAEPDSQGVSPVTIQRRKRLPRAVKQMKGKSGVNPREEGPPEDQTTGQVPPHETANASNDGNVKDRRKSVDSEETEEQEIKPEMLVTVKPEMMLVCEEPSSAGDSQRNGEDNANESEGENREAEDVPEGGNEEEGVDEGVDAGRTVVILANGVQSENTASRKGPEEESERDSSGGERGDGEDLAGHQRGAGDSGNGVNSVSKGMTSAEKPKKVWALRNSKRRRPVKKRRLV